MKKRRLDNENNQKTIQTLETKLKELTAKVCKLENENLRLRDKMRQLEDQLTVSETKRRENIQWLQPTWDLMEKKPKKISKNL